MTCPNCQYVYSVFDKVCPRCQGANSQAQAAAHSAAQAPNGGGGEWFYAHNGQRIGPIHQSHLAQLISQGLVNTRTPVWRNGMPDWVEAVNSDLAPLFGAYRAIVPPLAGAEVNNSIVWVLAFAPIISAFLQIFLGAMFETESINLWWIAILLNIGLSIADEKQLQKAGHNTDGMGIWTFFVPVYLFVRADRLKQNNGYAIVWLVTFFVSLFI